MSVSPRVSDFACAQEGVTWCGSPETLHTRSTTPALEAAICPSTPWLINLPAQRFRYRARIDRFFRVSGEPACASDGSTAAFNSWVDVASTLGSGINRMIANQKVELLPKMLPSHRIIRVFRVRSCVENSGKNCQFQVNSRSTAE